MWAEGRSQMSSSSLSSSREKPSTRAAPRRTDRMLTTPHSVSASTTRVERTDDGERERGMREGEREIGRKEGGGEGRAEGRRKRAEEGCRDG